LKKFILHESYISFQGLLELAKYVTGHFNSGILKIEVELILEWRMSTLLEIQFT
jgi:hypothetical protein